MAMLDAQLLTEIRNILAQIAANGPTNSQDSFTKYMEDIIKTFKDSQNLTKTELKSFAKEVFSTLKEGAGATSKMEDVLKQIVQERVASSPSKGMNNAQGKSEIKGSEIVSAFRTIVSSKLNDAVSKGGENKFFDTSKSKDSDSLKAITKALVAQTNQLNQNLSVMQKLANFFMSTKPDQDKKERKQFGEDLAEALGKNRTFVGLINDIISIIGIVGANFLKNFGGLGKLLSGALLVVMPTIAAILIKGIVGKIGGLLGNLLFPAKKAVGTMYVGNLVTAGDIGNLFKGKGGAAKVGKAILNTKGLGNSPIGKALTSPTKLGAFKALALPALVSMAATAAAVGAGKAASSTWKEGKREKDNLKKGGAIGFGLGAAGFGVTAIAALVAGIAAPVTAIAAVVGVIGVAIGAVLKYHKQIGEFLKKVAQIIFPVFGILGKAMNWILEKLNIKASKDEKTGNYQGGAPTLGEAISGDFKADGSKYAHWDKKAGKNVVNSSNSWDLANTEKAKIDPTTGKILNFASMTQEQAGREMERLRKEDPNSWNKNYEFVPFGKYGRKANFSTDVVSPDGKGFYAAKGSMARLDAANEAAKKAGYKGDIEFTGAIGSMGRYSDRQLSPHRLTGKGHASGIKYDFKSYSMGNSGMKKVGEFLKADGAFKGAKVVNEGDHADIVYVSGEERTTLRNAKTDKQSVKVQENKEIDQKIKEGQTSSTDKDKPTYVSTIKDKPVYLSTPDQAPKNVGVEPDITGNNLAQSKLLNTTANFTASGGSVTAQ